MKKCIFPGSFNPFTLGHYDIVVRGLKVYDEITVAVADETYKTDMLPLPGRVMLAKKCVEGLQNVTVTGFSGMLTDFVLSSGVYNLIRGVRNDSDMLYEKELENIYKKADGRIEVEYILSGLSHISSSLVRKIAKEGGRLDGLVPKQVIKDIKRLYV